LQSIPSQIRSKFKRLVQFILGWVQPNWAVFWSAKLAQLWVIALFVGVVAAVAVMIFREAIVFGHSLWAGTYSEFLASAAASAPWYMVIAGPTIGGAIVGWLLVRFLSNKRAGGVADVIESRAAGGRNLSLHDGLISALVSAVSLGSGASAGREGPMVHLGASLSAFVSSHLRLPDWSARTLLACGVGGAVAASFNAPIAAVLFAHEVVLGHYARRSFVPIVLASVAGTLASRLWLGNLTTFIIPDYQIASFWEFPAFAILGVVCALIAISFQISLKALDFWARNITMPLWLRPIIGGLIIGIMGLFLPQILGVGYEPTFDALSGKMELKLLLLLVVAKMLATAITMASRFGGGVFSPALYLGAMTGAAFGIISGGLLPQFASEPGLYATLGMGAVAATIIGAPISTIVIVFELTGGYEMTIALLMTISVASGVNQALHGRSFFEWQLEARGLFAHEGPHKYLLMRTRVSDFMIEIESNDTAPIDTPALLATDTLELALRKYDETGHSTLNVVNDLQNRQIIGLASHARALTYFNSALVKASEEEHQ